jgi:DNA-binding GntR family transcriptional regulator
LSACTKPSNPQAERQWLYASSIIGDLQISIAEHNDIIRALADGDPDRIERCLQANWDNGSQRLARVIDVFGERGSW